MTRPRFDLPNACNMRLIGTLSSSAQVGEKAAEIVPSDRRDRRNRLGGGVFVDALVDFLFG